MASNPRPIVVNGPSGCGKSTLIKKLMDEFDGCFAFSVSHTTRKPRPGEVHGKDYYYSEKGEVERMVKDGEFIEHAEFSGNHYGTSFKAVEDIQSTGKICILDVDMQGVKNIKATNLDPRYIFIKPPNEQILETRLRGRGTETEEAIQKRLARAKAEIEYGTTPGSFDEIIVNDELDKAYEKLKAVLLDDLKAIKKANESSPASLRNIFCCGK